ncbi:ABC transporter permease [Sinorhizobium meliloti]|uniref:ABC transporter permease n=1 Tax=Rhizobium meliloti TaxID=382 RepID=UPI000374062D|nr:ABC transporter permease [Sinorhizobium meliloti]
MRRSILLRWIHTGIVALVAFYLVLPILIIIPMSFSPTEFLELPWQGLSLRWYQAALANTRWHSAFADSALIAIATMVLAGVLGVAAALALSKSQSATAKLLAGLYMAPVTTPIVVLAIGLYMVLIRTSLSGSMYSLVIGHTVIALPYVFITTLTSLRLMSRNLVDASLSLGVGPIRTFFWVTFPLLRPALLAGLVLAFVVSWDEVELAIFLSTPGTVTAPVLLWQSIRFNVTPEIAAVGSMLIIVSLLGLVVFQALRRSPHV